MGSRSPDQIVIVVEGPVSKDVTDLLFTWNQSPIFYIVYLPNNVGLGPALNQGLLQCQHEIICRFDTDDINAYSRLALTINAFIENPLLDVFCSSIFEFSCTQDGSCSGRFKDVPETNLGIKNSLLFRNVINHPSSAFRKSSIIKIGSYDAVPFFEDYYLWLKCRKENFVFASISVPLVFMRRSSVLMRRSGIFYAVCEARFLILLIFRRLLPLWCFPVFLTRIFLRLLPPYFQTFQDRFPWRSESFVCLNPDFSDNLDFDNFLIR